MVEAPGTYDEYLTSPAHLLGHLPIFLYNGLDLSQGFVSPISHSSSTKFANTVPAGMGRRA